MAVDCGPSDELAGDASRTWGTSWRYNSTRVAIDKADETTVYMYSFVPHPSGDAGVPMRVMEVMCLSTAANICIRYAALHLTSCPEYHHTTTISGLSERHSATLPNFQSDKKIRAKIAPATARHIGGDVGVIRFALLVKQRIHIGDTLAFKDMMPPLDNKSQKSPITDAPVNVSVLGKKKILHLVRNKPNPDEIFSARSHVVSASSP